MKEHKVEHVPTDKIVPKKYKIYCSNPGCTNIIATSDKPFPYDFLRLSADTPCSKCKDPIDYLKTLTMETTDK